MSAIVKVGVTLRCGEVGLFASAWPFNGGNEEQGGTGRGPARGGDRFASALISLALDKGDATEVLPQRRVGVLPSHGDLPDSGVRFVAIGIAPAIAKPVIPFAATRSPVTAVRRNTLVNIATARVRSRRGEKHS